MDVIGSIDKKETAWKRSMVEECSEGDICIQYSVQVQVDELVQDGTTGEAVINFLTQACVQDGTLDWGDKFCDSICMVWETGLEQLWENNPETAGMFSNVEANCGELTACGDECLHGAAAGL